MSVGTLNPQQLKTIVEDKWQSDPDAVAFGLHVSSAWKGPPEVDFEFGTAHVLRADTVFQIREALLEAEEKNDRIILLTNLQQGELGHDVVARMARSRVFHINHVASLCGLFKAKELDRSICEPGIAEVLLEYAPRDGYPPVSAGVLDAETVWRAVCRHVFKMGDREPDLVTLLLWATTTNGPQRYIEADDKLRGSLRSRLVYKLGDVANSILQFIDSEAGPNAVALAATCQVIFGKDTDEILDVAAARLDQYHNNNTISKHVGRELGRLATEAIADLDKSNDDPRVAGEHLNRADELLKQTQSIDHAFRSNLTAEGYQQRLARLGAAITQAISEPTDEHIESVESRQRSIASHRMGKQGRYKNQVARSEMAVRLIRWLKQDVPTPHTFAEMAAVFTKELSFADWARESICRGDDTAELSAAYKQLDEAVATRQSKFSEVFAKAMANSATAGLSDTAVLGVEDVLENVVGKVVAAKNRVLLIVLDGMSWAVCHELLETVREDHWYEATLDDNSAVPPPVIATIPSETKYSRTSLLSGELTTGDQSTERSNFSKHPILAHVSDNHRPPLLFHKKDITEGSRGTVSKDLSKAILATNQAIVGVVINAIDDRLSNAQQIRDNWTIDRIIPLSALLRLARDSGRVVILASDHGHVWHQENAEYDPSSEGSRWRKDDGQCQDGEIAVSGKRVLAAEGDDSIIVPWSETKHYKRKQHGYHGGASPQEMVCPLVLLTDKSSAYLGLSECSYPKPDWWSPSPEILVVEGEVIRVTKKSTAIEASGQMLLDQTYEAAEETTDSDANWIDRLLSAQGYKDQKAMIRRHPVDDDTVRASLTALDSNGGIMTPLAFAKAANVPTARLDGLIARMQRILNVDGYEIIVLDRSENKVELNVAKLRRQFDIE